MRSLVGVVVLALALVPSSGFGVLTGDSIIDEAEVQSIDGFPFNNSAFDPYILAVDGTTVYFASVNITTTYTDSQVFGFDIDADQTAVAASELFNDTALKALYSGTNSFWFLSSGDVDATYLYTITAEDADGDDGEFIETGDLNRVIRVSLSTGAVEDVAAASADGAVGLTEHGGTLYLLTRLSYGATESGLATISAAATGGSMTYLFDTAAIVAVTGGAAPELTSIATTPTGNLVFGDDETSQILTVTDLGGTPALSVLVDNATLTGTSLGAVDIRGVAVLSNGDILVSDGFEAAAGDNSRGIVVFDSTGAFKNVMATELDIDPYIGGNDHQAFYPNNELQMSSDDRLVICNTDNAETIYWLQDQQPMLSIDDVQTIEGGTAGFTVTLSPTSASTVTVAFTTNDGTATAPDDYGAASGTLTFDPGVATQPIDVNTVDDGIYEGDETFTVDLSSPSGATIDDDQGLGTIQDNESPVTISIADTSVLEGDAGASPTMSYDVTLSGASAAAVSVDWASADGTATAGVDYTSGSGTVNFTPGDTSESVVITVIGDDLDEPDETVLVNLTNPSGATIADDQGSGLILDDDAMPNLSASDASQCEGIAVAVVALLDAVSGFEASVDYATVAGTATAGDDFVAASGTLIVPAGEQRGAVVVELVGDSDMEGDEQFQVAFSNPTNCVLQTSAVTVTICDDESGTCIFADGFESGDTSAWSGVVP